MKWLLSTLALAVVLASGGCELASVLLTDDAYDYGPPTPIDGDWYKMGDPDGLYFYVEGSFFELGNEVEDSEFGYWGDCVVKETGENEYRVTVTIDPDSHVLSNPPAEAVFIVKRAGDRLTITQEGGDVSGEFVEYEQWESTVHSADQPREAEPATSDPASGEPTAT